MTAKPQLLCVESAWLERDIQIDFGQGSLVEVFVRQRQSKSDWLAEIDRLVDCSRMSPQVAGWHVLSDFDLCKAAVVAAMACVESLTRNPIS